MSTPTFDASGTIEDIRKEIEEAREAIENAVENGSPDTTPQRNLRTPSRGDLKESSPMGEWAVWLGIAAAIITVSLLYRYA